MTRVFQKGFQKEEEEEGSRNNYITVMDCVIGLQVSSCPEDHSQLLSKIYSLCM